LSYVKDHETEKMYFKIDQIDNRILYLLMKMAKSITIKDLMETFNGDELLKFPRETLSANEIIEKLSFCTVLLDNNKNNDLMNKFLKIIEVEELSTIPKERFDQLFEIKTKYSSLELENFFKQLATKDQTFISMVQKFTRRITNDQGSYYVLKNDT